METVRVGVKDYKMKTKKKLLGEVMDHGSESEWQGDMAGVENDHSTLGGGIVDGGLDTQCIEIVPCYALLYYASLFYAMLCHALSNLTNRLHHILQAQLWQDVHPHQLCQPHQRSIALTQT